MNNPIPIRASRPALAPVPRILPDTTDALLVERAWAHVRTATAGYSPRIPLAAARRQGNYARRLDAIAAQRGQE